MQGILNIKFKLETQEKIFFQNAMNALNEEQNKLQSLNDRKAEFEGLLCDLMGSRLDLLKIKQCEESIETMKGFIKQQITVVKRTEHLVEVARKRLTDIMIERKTHEILKEKAFEEYKLEFDRQERKEVDELTSFQYIQKGVES